LQAAEVWPTTQPTWRMCCRLCSQSTSEISVRKKCVSIEDLTSTGEGMTGDVNSESPYPSTPYGAVCWGVREAHW
jgi:hypothetical protein